MLFAIRGIPPAFKKEECVVVYKACLYKENIFYMEIFLRRFKSFPSSLKTMKILLPQEVDVWYVLPFVRKELAVILKNEHSLSQKNIASLLGITESAVSQYIHLKRAQDNDMEIPATLKQTLRKAADQLRAGTSFLEVSSALLQSDELLVFKCKLHKHIDKNISPQCDVCLR